MLFLIKRGVPWEVAINLPPHESLAFCVIFGEQEGGKFNWSALKWEQPKA